MLLSSGRHGGNILPTGPLRRTVRLLVPCPLVQITLLLGLQKCPMSLDFGNLDMLGGKNLSDVTP
jgi:hypothetical protein